MAENHFQPRPDDMQLLEDIAKDESAPPLHRSKAAVTRGLMHWLKHDRELAKTEYRRAIKAAEAVSTAERERKAKVAKVASQATNAMAAVRAQLDLREKGAADKAANKATTTRGRR